MKRHNIDQDEFVRLYDQQTNPKLARYFGVSVGTIKDWAKDMGLTKPAGFLSRFQQQNAGGAATRFGGSGGRLTQARILPGTVLWTTAYSRIGDGPEYYFYQGKGHPIALKRHIWQVAGGVVPKGYLLRYWDGNPRRCVLENLICVSRADNARFNTNREAFRQTYRQGRFAPSYYASRLFMKDPAMREFALEHLPELVEAKRQQLILQHQLTNPDHG